MKRLVLIAVLAACGGSSKSGDTTPKAAPAGADGGVATQGNPCGGATSAPTGGNPCGK